MIQFIPFDIKSTGKIGIDQDGFFHEGMIDDVRIIGSHDREEVVYDEGNVFCILYSGDLYFSCIEYFDMKFLEGIVDP